MVGRMFAVAVLIASLILGGLAPSWAELVTFNYSGAVTGTSDPTMAALFPLGTPYSMSYTFDPATPVNTASSNANGTVYSNPVTNALVTLGGMTWSFMPSPPGSTVNYTFVASTFYYGQFSLDGSIVGSHFAAQGTAFALAYHG